MVPPHRHERSYTDPPPPDYPNPRKAMITLSTIVQSSDRQVSSDLAGEQVILNLENGVYYGLDAVGNDVWSLLEHPVAVSTVVDRLLEMYEVDRSRLEADVLALLNDMNEHDLLVVNPSDASVSA